MLLQRTIGGSAEWYWVTTITPATGGEKLPYHIASSAVTCNILDYSTAVPQWQININKLEVEVNNNGIYEHATPVSMKHNHIF